jgi:hypothetical protein
MYSSQKAYHKGAIEATKQTELKDQVKACSNKICKNSEII